MAARKETGKQGRQAKKRKGAPRYRLPLVVTGALGVVLVLALVLVLSLTGGGSGEPSSPTTGPPPTDLQRVGLLEVSATDVDLGQVALDQWVDHTFVLRNASTGTLTVTVPKKSIETLEGCCPPAAVSGPATTGDTFVFNNMAGEPISLPASTNLAPGEELNFVVVLKMHEGMGGPHVFRLQLPVVGPDGEEQTVELYLRGLFG